MKVFLSIIALRFSQLLSSTSGRLLRRMLSLNFKRLFLQINKRRQIRALKKRYHL